VADWLRKRPGDTAPDIRDVLFGDVPLHEWAGQDRASAKAPWSWFVSAAKHLEAGNRPQAIEQLKKVIEAPGLESRHYLQAWYFLRQLGAPPPVAQAKEVYGVVVEYALEQGLDIVAAYADHTARYFNYSGAAVIWENADDSLNRVIDDLLDAGRNIVQKIGPWEGDRPPAPPRGQARVSMLTPSGLHFGQAPSDALANDGMGGPILAAAIGLMKALIGKSGKTSA
jgi:hypothetical protein